MLISQLLALGNSLEFIDWSRPTLVSSSIMFCCSMTWSFKNSVSCSSLAWSRSFRDFNFFKGGWDVIFSLWVGKEESIGRDFKNPKLQWFTWIICRNFMRLQVHLKIAQLHRRTNQNPQVYFICYKSKSWGMFEDLDSCVVSLLRSAWAYHCPYVIQGWHLFLNHHAMSQKMRGIHCTVL